MAREVVNPTQDEHGAEEHPAWGLIGASRVQSGPPGAVLFDSDIRHMHTVRIRIHQARRQRSLHRDHIYTARPSYIEVELSEAQWASFVSSMNAGDGVPCTVRSRSAVGAYEQVPEVPYEPRLQESMNEVRGAAQEAQRKVLEALEAYLEKKNAANLRTLEFAIRNMPSNIAFAAKSLTEHAENVVQRARADIEAMVVSKAQKLGLEAGDLGLALQLEAGDYTEEETT